MNQQEQHSNHQQPAQQDQESSSSSSSSSKPPSEKRDKNGGSQREKSSSSQREERKSRSRSREKQKSHHGLESDRLSNHLLGNIEYNQEKIKEDQQKQPGDTLKMKKNTSKIANTKQDKNKKKKVQRLYLTDFTDFLPESLLLISRTNVTSKIRIGERYQANVQTEPRYLSQNRSLQDWKIWDGSSFPQNKPTEQHLWRFKQLLGQNRNEEELIGMRMRIGSKSWRQVLQYVGNNRAELRRIFHNAQRNRLIG